MKRYILFTEEELTDLGKGNEIKHTLSSGETLYFMCTERFRELCNDEEYEDEEYEDEEYEEED